MPRKRPHAEVEASEPVSEDKEMSLIQRIRNTWEFASVMQYIFMFGKTMKIDEDFDIEDFENECLKPGYSEKLEEIGLQLLRFVSSNRGLNLDNWDEYVRRQYQSKSPAKNHPYGDEEEPRRFRHFDTFTKVRVLHQLSVWTFWNPDRIRGALPDVKESEQLDWRMNVFGWDEEDREYFVLDDSRLYRRSEPPPPPPPKWKPKANSIKARADRRRANKRRKLEEVEADIETNDEDEGIPQANPSDGDEQDPAEQDTFGGYKWECVAITLEDYQTFIGSLKTSVKNFPNERAMRDRLIEEVLPTIQELADKQKRKQERRERELQMMERMAGAKRSGRLADKQDRERREREEVELARKHAADLAAAHREQERQEKMEQERQSRMMTREQRIKDREFKRLLMEEELARDSEEQKRIEEGEKRGSERHIREKIEKNKKELEELANEEEWTFDCSGCGMHGKNLDDGSHSIACERCSVWQHSKCLGISKAAAEKDDFTLVCSDCRKKERQEAKRKEEEEHRREEEANKPKIMLKFKPGQSSSPPQLPAPMAVFPPSNASGHLPAPFMNGYPAAQQPPARQLTNMQPSHLPQGQPLTSLTPQQRASQPVQSAGHFGGEGRPPPAVFNANPNMPAAYQGPVNQQQQYARQQIPPTQASNPSRDHIQYRAQAQPSHPLAQPIHTPSPPVHSTPSSGSNHAQHYHTSRLPSPILNKPKMSPTQGNLEVGPIAGVPNSSPSHYHPTPYSAQINGTPRGQMNGAWNSNLPSSPTQRTSQTPQPQHLSGLSPVKQRSPLPPPGNIPEKLPLQPTSPPAANGAQSKSASFESNASAISSMPSFDATPNAAVSRTVSGTPIFPPAEKLAPSPEHVDKGPVPTPSKQPTPSPHPSFDMSNTSRNNMSSQN